MRTSTSSPQPRSVTPLIGRRNSLNLVSASTPMLLWPAFSQWIAGTTSASTERLRVRSSSSTSNDSSARGRGLTSSYELHDETDGYFSRLPPEIRGWITSQSSSLTASTRIALSSSAAMSSTTPSRSFPRWRDMLRSGPSCEHGTSYLLRCRTCDEQNEKYRKSLLDMMNAYLPRS